MTRMNADTTKWEMILAWLAVVQKAVAGLPARWGAYNNEETVFRASEILEVLLCQ